MIQNYFFMKYFNEGFEHLMQLHLPLSFFLFIRRHHASLLYSLSPKCMNIPFHTVESNLAHPDLESLLPVISKLLHFSLF